MTSLTKAPKRVHSLLLPFAYQSLPHACICFHAVMSDQTATIIKVT